MKSIESFRNCKIETLQDIYGGRDVRESYKPDTKEVIDKNVMNDAGCTVKYVENTGFWNWLSGNRTVTTYDGNCNCITHFNSDGSVAGVEWHGGNATD